MRVEKRARGGTADRETDVLRQPTGPLCELEPVQPCDHDDIARVVEHWPAAVTRLEGCGDRYPVR